MNNISNINTQVPAGQVHAPQVPMPAAKDGASQEAHKPPGVDKAEISELGQLLAVARDLPDVRAQKVAQVRAAIQEDEQGYIEKRLDGTVQRIIDDLSVQMHHGAS